MEPNNIDVENETINDINIDATNAEKFKEIINNIPDEDLETLSKINLESMDPETLDGVLGGLSSETRKLATLMAALVTTIGVCNVGGYFIGRKSKIDEELEYENLYEKSKMNGIRDGYTAGILIDTLGDKEAKGKFNRLYKESKDNRKEIITSAEEYLKKQMNR